MKRKRWIGPMSIVLAVAVLIGTGVAYISDYYRADTAAIDAFSQIVPVTETPLDGAIAYGSGKEDTAFVFYPGGKVEYTAYAPLMRALSAKGVLCVLVEMPCNLAVLDVHAAADIRELYPDVTTWYIGGHSLGGSMAASHMDSTGDCYCGLVLLGAYSTADLTDNEVAVLSIYGSEDLVMNREKYETCKSNLPQDVTEMVIEGGCHAQFGMYGVQDGDGTPTITAQQQLYLTADAIAQFMAKGDADAENH